MDYRPPFYDEWTNEERNILGFDFECYAPEQDFEGIVAKHRNPEDLVFKKAPYYRDDRGVLRRYPTEAESREGLLRFLRADADAVSEAL